MTPPSGRDNGLTVGIIDKIHDEIKEHKQECTQYLENKFVPKEEFSKFLRKEFTPVIVTLDRIKMWLKINSVLIFLSPLMYYLYPKIESVLRSAISNMIK